MDVDNFFLGLEQGHNTEQSHDEDRWTEEADWDDVGADVVGHCLCRLVPQR